MSATDKFIAAQQRLLKRFGVNAESRFLDLPVIAGRAHVLACGDGQPVVMVPGFADPAAMWAPLMARLDGFRLHAVDRPCFGLSGSAAHTTGTLRRLAVDFLEQVLDALKLERPLIVGNSLGSLWCIWLALDRPDRVAAMVHVGCPALILGTSAPLPMRLLSVRLVGRVMTQLLPPSPRQVEGFAKAVGGEDFSRLPELTDLLVAAQEMPGAQRSMLELLHAAIRLRGARPEVTLTAQQLAQIRQPLLLIWGESDAFGTPQVAREATQLMPNAKLHLVADGGHVCWIGYTSEVAAAALPFLRMQIPARREPG